jgi:hypothetical protein
MSERYQHDVAWAASTHILEVFAPLLREEEKREALVEVYTRVKAALECYALQIDRMQHRLRPGKN